MVLILVFDLCAGVALARIAPGREPAGRAVLAGDRGLLPCGLQSVAVGLKELLAYRALELVDIDETVRRFGKEPVEPSVCVL